LQRDTARFESPPRPASSERAFNSCGVPSATDPTAVDDDDAVHAASISFQDMGRNTWPLLSHTLDEPCFVFLVDRGVGRLVEDQDSGSWRIDWARHAVL